MISFMVNGQGREVDADPATPLLYVLRDHLGLHGAKFGCGLGQCGACTVIVDGQPIFSCLMPVAALQDRRVMTIEGLGSSDEPNPLQQAFIAEQAAQCGYCTNGIVMSAVALLRATANPSREQIKSALDGSLCRCGSHDRVLRAVARAANGGKS